MLTASPPAPQLPATASLRWYQGLTGYQWFVLTVCFLGWFFDTLDMQLFVLARRPAITELLGAGAQSPEIGKIAGIATAIFMLGAATGGIIFGVLGDKWGRAKSMFTAVFCYSLFTGLSAFSLNWIDFSIYRFITGMGIGGTFGCACALIAEVAPARSRPYALGFMQALAALGNMLAAAISFAIPPGIAQFGISGWRLIFLIGVAPAILALFVMRRLKEPEAWVLAKKAAAAAPAGSRVGKVSQLLTDPRWRRNVLIGVALGIPGIIGVWGVSFFLPDFIREIVPGTKPEKEWYVSLAMLLFNFAAAIGTYLLAALMGAIGRKGGLAVIFFLGLAGIITVFGFLSAKSQIAWMAPLLGFCTLPVLGAYSVYFPELFPLRFRATGTGVCYNSARYLAAAAPFIFGMLITHLAAPAGSERAGLTNWTLLSSLGSADQPIRYAAIIVASVYLLGLLVLPFATETKGKPLPE